MSLIGKITIYYKIVPNSRCIIMTPVIKYVFFKIINWSKRLIFIKIQTNNSTYPVNFANTNGKCSDEILTFYSLNLPLNDLRSQTEYRTYLEVSYENFWLKNRFDLRTDEIKFDTFISQKSGMLPFYSIVLSFVFIILFLFACTLCAFQGWHFYSI